MLNVNKLFTKSCYSKELEDIQIIIPAKDISWNDHPYCSFDDFSFNQHTTNSGDDEMEREEGENEEYEEYEEYEECEEEEGKCNKLIIVEENDEIITGK